MVRLGCTGPPWFSWDDPQKRSVGARRSTCAGLQLSCPTSYRGAEKPKMVPTSSSSPIRGLRPRIRGWSVIFWGWPLLGLFAGGGVHTPGGREGGSAQLGWKGGKGCPLILPVTCFLERSKDADSTPSTISMLKIEDHGSSSLLYLGPRPPSLLHLTRADSI